MNFETEYKNITFNISLEKEDISDVSLLMGDKFNRLPNQTMIELKKKTLSSYNLIIISSSEKNEEITHYLSGVILTSNESDLPEELQDYLETEQILDNIADLWIKYLVEPGPIWRVKL